MGLKTTAFFLLFFLMAGTVSAQNPFDLKHRVQLDSPESVQKQEEDETQAKPEVRIPDTDTLSEGIEESELLQSDTIDDLSIGLDIALADLTETDQFEEDDAPEVSSADEEVRAPTPPVRERTRSNLLLLIFLLVSIIIALVIAVDRSIMDKIYRSLINHNFMNFFLREQKGGTSLQLFFLFLVFLVNLGIFLMFFARDLLIWPTEVKLWQTTGLVTIIYVGRYIFTGYLNLFVGARKELRQYYFTTYIFNIFLGLVLFPLNAFIAFAPDFLAFAALYISLGFVIVLYFLRQMRGLFMGSKYLLTNQFHFFIYLCTVEIAPLVLMGKFFISISS